MRSWAPHSSAGFSLCTWANLSFRKTSFFILTYASYPGQAKMPDFSCILQKLIFTFFEMHFLQYSCRCSDNKDTFHHWNKLALHLLLGTALCRWPEVWCLFVLADHYLLYRLFMPCVYPGIIFEGAAVVQQCNAQCIHSWGKSLQSLGRWKCCPCLAAGLAAARSMCPEWFWSQVPRCFQ